MIRLLGIGLVLIIIMAIATAEPEDTPAELIESHMWESPVLLLFIPDTKHSDWQEQQMILSQIAPSLDQMHVARYELIYRNHIRRNGATLPHIPASRFFASYNVPSERFTLIMIDQSGEELLRSEAPVPTAKLLALLKPEQ